MKNSYSKLYDAQSTPFEISQNSIKIPPYNHRIFLLWDYKESNYLYVKCFLNEQN